MITPPNSGLGKVAKSRQGLEHCVFKDALGVNCVLQTVTLAMSEGGVGLALGAQRAAPRLQARDARALGLKTTQKTGLVKFPVPDEVTFDTKAFLTRQQVKDLVYRLNGWLYGGSMEAIPFPEHPEEKKRLTVVDLGVDLASGRDQSVPRTPLTPDQIKVQEEWEEIHGVADNPAEDPYTKERILDAAQEATKPVHPKLADEVQNGG